MSKQRGGVATPPLYQIKTSNPYSILSSDFADGPSSKKRPKSDTSTSSSGRFLIASHADPEKNLSKVNPFIVMKALEGYTMDLKEVSRLRNGTLLIETRNQRQADILYKASTLGDTPITVKDHPTLNTVRGTVFSYDLLELDEEYLLENLKEQNISKVERVKKFNASRELVPTPLLILTFESKVVPISIKAGFLSLRTRKHYPMPLKCKTCHIFGHTAKRCRGQRLCVSCGELSHSGECIAVKCNNCTKHYPLFSNQHRANDRSCLKYLEEKEIVRIMVDENKMYNDARTKFNQLYPKTSTSSTFAATVWNNNATPTNINSNPNKKFKSVPTENDSPQPSTSTSNLTSTPHPEPRQSDNPHSSHHPEQIKSTNPIPSQKSPQNSTPTKPANFNIQSFNSSTPTPSTSYAAITNINENSSDNLQTSPIPTIIDLNAMSDDDFSDSTSIQTFRGFPSENIKQ